jgi:glycosyltransferase involved in cell wall biosynthesis
VTAGAVARIGVVMPLAEQRGGAEMALLNFLTFIAPEMAAWVRLCFLEAGPMVEWAQQRGYAVTVVRAGRLRQLGSWSRAVRDLYTWMRQNDIGVVLSWMPKAHLYAGPAAWLAGVRAVWWQHGVPARRSIDALVSLVPAQRILACSGAAVAAQRQLSGRRADVVAVYPGVDIERLERSERTRVGREALGIDEQALVIGIVARLERWKGIDVVVRAFAQLSRAHPQLQLLVVGGPHPLQPAYASELQQLPRALGIQRVTFTGHQSDATKWMCEMDIVVSASFGEPFGMVIVEAMALGKAVVATRAGGPPEIVTDGINGLLVEPGDVSGLVAALSRLIESSALRRQLGAAGRERARRFAAPRFAADVLAAVRQEPA